MSDENGENGTTDDSRPTDDTPPASTMSDIATDPETERESTTSDPASESRDAPGDTEPTDAESSRFDRFTTSYLRGLLDRIALGALVLLALIAGWSFYSQTGTAIRTWLDPAYQPLALAAFNLAILLVAVAGIAHQLSRIRKSEDGEGTASSGE
ncbi:hypothetical protein [Halorubrum sp. DTA46]|uniref:hypothetical protein n=1 Tax=Halorubrum sp. DTA46 TaxID=3402162 RepID=UPI003AAE7E87